MVKISGDSSGFQKELNKTQDATETAFSVNPINGFTGALQGAVGGVSKIQSALSSVALMAAGGFGIGSLMESAITAGDNVYKLATILGTSSAEASGLSRTLKLADTDSQTFALTMAKMDKKLTEGGEAGEKLSGFLDVFGVSLTDSSGKLLPVTQQLGELAKGYKVAAANGVEQEYVVNTLGARGLSLVGVLKDYNEASEKASKVKGIGLDPAQMHEIKQELQLVQMEASQVSLAFTSAWAPIAQEIFPAVMSGLQGVAGVLAENKTEVISLTKETLGVVVAYKSLGMLGAVVGTIGTAWQNAALQADASMATVGNASTVLTAKQQKNITQIVAASDKGYLKMQADAIKAAQAMGLSAEETAVIIKEKCLEISAEGTIVAEKLRADMTASYLQQNVAAAESATIQKAEMASVAVTATETAAVINKATLSTTVATEEMAATKLAVTTESAEACAAVTASSVATMNEAILSTGIAAEEANAIKTAATTESAELCTAVTVGSSLEQVEAIAGVGVAATLTGEKQIAANSAAVVATEANTLAQGELAIATATAGTEAVIAGEKTVGAMATAGVATSNLLSVVWALAGGWLGVAVAVGYALYKMNEYGNTAGRIKGYNPDAETKYADGKYYKKQIYDGEDQTDEFGNTVKWKGMAQWTELSDDEYAAQYQYDEDQKNKKNGTYKPDIPDIDPNIAQKMKDAMAGPGKKEKKTGKSDEEKEYEKMQKEANKVNNEILKEYSAMNNSKVDIVNAWYDTEKQKLDESQGANTAYNEALDQLNAVHQDKLRKANAEELASIASFNNEAQKLMLETQDSVSSAGLTGIDKQLNDLEKNHRDKLLAIDKEFESLNLKYQDMSKGDQTKQQDAWAKAGIKPTYHDDGSVTFEKEINAQKLAADKDHEQSVKDLHADTAKFEKALDDAKQEGDIATFAETLNSKQALVQQNLSGTQELISAFYDSWKEEHRTAASYMAEATNSFRSGMTSTFKSMITDISSAKSAWVSFRDVVLDVIADIISKQLSANLTNNILSSFGFGSSSSSSNSYNAEVGSSDNGFASGGLLQGPGTGTSDSIPMYGSNGEYMMQASSVSKFGVGFFDSLNAGRIPKFATGGLITTGPSLSSLSTVSSAGNVVSTSNSGSKTPNVQINVTNNTDSQVTAQNTTSSFDGETYVLDVVLNGVATNKSGFNSNLKAALGV
jgi:hypothetical protein